MVDKAFLDFLANLIGKDVLQRFKDDHMEDYIDLLRDFEIKKRATNSSSEGLVTIKLPLALLELVDESKGLSMKRIVQSSRYADKVILVGEKFRLDFSIFRSFFKESVNAIVNHLQSLLKEGEPSKAEAILMVGGYSESPLLAETMREKFPRLKIIVPTDAGLAVLKGAVIFGHCPTSISERMSKYTYGIYCRVPFNKDKHPIDKLIKTDHGDRCDDIFNILVSADQTLVVGKKQAEQRCHPSFINQTEMNCKIYTSTNKDAKYVTDEGCRKVGCITIPVSGRGIGRAVIIRLYFGGTEIMIEGEEEATGRITSTVVDFLL
ncbi:hypothetical protein DPMN_166903 [Dreissena polymorpha]|uniref:Uncharacterized protein n=1 Tax=Dreissena polymorpha TaxID=45954 RepID=A0A9D4EXT8_DREPO|nr:hypothetical protein DPMN_166903 [Dreissena polymorpha]